MVERVSRQKELSQVKKTYMLELPLPDRCDVIYVPCLLALNRGEDAKVQGSAGVTDGWTSVCNVALTEYDQWSVEVDVLPELPVHMVIGMDIISTGNLSLAYEEGGYIFRFEQQM